MMRQWCTKFQSMVNSQQIEVASKSRGWGFFGRLIRKHFGQYVRDDTQHIVAQKLYWRLKIRAGRLEERHRFLDELLERFEQHGAVDNVRAAFVLHQSAIDVRCFKSKIALVFGFEAT
jgi:hypothetical protein